MNDESKHIHLCLAHLSGNEEHYIHEAFETNWVTSLGKNVDTFEEQIRTYILSHSIATPHDETRQVAALASGTAAVHLGLLLLGVGKGDEVLCQSWTFAASANPIVYLGAQPVFVDSENATWNISPELLEAAIEDRIRITGRKPKAIVVIDLYGMPAKWNEILKISRRYGIPVLEDSAEAIGSAYKGQLCGTFGDFGVFSFNGNKMITTGSGGVLICPSVEAKKRTLFYSTQARENFPHYQHERIGYNYRLSNISAGIGRGQMEVLDEHIAHHRRLADLYCELFGDTDEVEVHTNPSSDFNSNYWLTTIVLHSPTAAADVIRIREHLAACRIESRPLWKPMHLQPIFASAPRYLNDVSGSLWTRGLCLPSGPCVTEADVRRIVAEIKYSLCKKNC